MTALKPDDHDLHDLQSVPYFEPVEEATKKRKGHDLLKVISPPVPYEVRIIPLRKSHNDHNCLTTIVTSMLLNSVIHVE